MWRFSAFALIACFAALLCIASGCSSSVTSPPTINGPIHPTVFPPVVGRQYIYAGFGIQASSGGALPDPQNQYRTSWTIESVTPHDTTQTFTILDSTTIPALTPATTVITLTFVRDTIRGNISLYASLGPVLRQYGLGNITDTSHLIMLARPSAALFGTWIAFDSSFSDTSGVPFELLYTGVVVDTERIEDSTSLHVVHYVYRFRVIQNVIVNGSLFAATVYTELWLENKTGPLQMFIAQDAENAGNFRVLRSKNF